MKRVVVVGCLCSALCIAGCGGDDGSNDGDPSDVGNSGAGGGGAGATGGGGAAPLPADTAGKACANDTECAPGTCAMMVEGLDGQPTPAPGGYCMHSCRGTADCGAGGVCVAGQPGQPGLCYDGCSGDTDCREGYLCGPITSTCRPAPPTDQLADGVAGTACAADADCGDGLCLTMRAGGDPYPGGYCSGACLEDAHCGAGGFCRRTGGGAGRCYATCATDADCTRDGYRCRELGGGTLGCLPAPDPLPDGTAGLACASDADCGGGPQTCATELPVPSGGSAPALGGYCTLACEVAADCGEGGVCVLTRSGTRCFKTCAAETECRDGYVCGERGGGTMPSIVCTPIDPGADADAGI